MRFERSEVTSRLVRFLSSFDKGTRITYDTLSTNLGMSITATNHLLRSARSILQNEHNQVWVPIPGVGICRLTDVEIAERQRRWWLPGAQRKLVRGRKQVATVDAQHLTIDDQARMATANIQTELALQALSRATNTRINKVARGTSNDLPSFNALEWSINLMKTTIHKGKAP